jgi:hypothetical protein
VKTVGNLQKVSSGRACPEGKAPSTKHQAPEKHQFSSAKQTHGDVCDKTKPKTLSHDLEFGSWSFSGAWRLVLGACFFILLFRCLHCTGAEIVLNPSADTALLEVSPANNMGGLPYFNAGSNMHGQRNRGLIRFDLTSIPAGSRIDHVTFSIRVIWDPVDEPASSIFDLHRMLKPWGEGDKLADQGPGRGSPATEGEATWMDRFAFVPGAAWETPGGADGNDFVAATSAEQFIVDSSSSPYYFSAPQLAADVQWWLDHPESNYGWLFKTRDETTPSTARRFASHEDPSNTPELTIAYSSAPPQITDARIEAGRFRFTFVAKAGESYTVQFRDGLSPTNSWATLDTISAQPSETTVVVFDSLSSNRRFYRVASP